MAGADGVLDAGGGAPHDGAVGWTGFGAAGAGARWASGAGAVGGCAPGAEGAGSGVLAAAKGSNESVVLPGRSGVVETGRAIFSDEPSDCRAARPAVMRGRGATGGPSKLRGSVLRSEAAGTGAAGCTGAAAGFGAAAGLGAA